MFGQSQCLGAMWTLWASVVWGGISLNSDSNQTKGIITERVEQICLIYACVRKRMFRSLVSLVSHLQQDFWRITCFKLQLQTHDFVTVSVWAWPACLRSTSVPNCLHWRFGESDNTEHGLLNVCINKLPQICHKRHGGVMFYPIYHRSPLSPSPPHC